MNKKTRRKILGWMIIFSLLFVLVEIYLRAYWGFCDNVLMMYSPNYEYIEQPNQKRFRFRDHIYYNKYSMRSPEVDSSALIILGFGDSIINGGVMVDQDSLTTTLLSKALTDTLHQKIQVLNIGAGSWGPDNDFAYLKEKGNFNARIIFLLVSSHDAHDNMDFQPVIDKVNRYESKQYKSAIMELIEKYLIPKVFENSGGEETAVIKKGKEFNTGFLNFYEYCKEKKIPFFIYLHPDKNELAEQQYNPQGQKIIDFCKQYNIPCIQSLHSIKPEDYRGVIHMNHSGQRHMKEDLLPVILSTLRNNQTANVSSK
ncbi:MAG: hypothetical protein JSS98_10530 [Bacteroidetes bacterium]|nr:hypothetical protein [Bacteroidota bacterium]